MPHIHTSISYEPPTTPPLHEPCAARHDGEDVFEIVIQTMLPIQNTNFIRRAMDLYTSTCGPERYDTFSR